MGAEQSASQTHKPVKGGQMSFEELRTWAARCIAWDDVSYASLHHRATVGTAIPGRPCRDISQLANSVERRLRDKPGDLWLCMATLDKVDTKEGNSGKPYAASLRKIENAVGYKSIWMDIDVGPTKIYKTLADAITALKKLIKAFLPPSMIVKSGGGLHVYWCLTESVSQALWRPLAHGLVALAAAAGLVIDAGCSTDPVRILRLPGTWNYKTTPPLPVTLAIADGPTYFLEKLQAKLPNSQESAFVLKSDIHIAPQAPADPDDDLAAGITKPTYAPRNADQVGSVCPLVWDTLNDGGVGQKQPLWHLMLGLAAGCEDPEVVAHRMSMGYATYHQQETDEEIARVIKERAVSRTLGPARCKTLQTAGATQCATCPHLQLNLSPLNVPGAYTNGHTHTATPTSISILPLPLGYSRGRDNYIYRDSVDTEGIQSQDLVFPFQVNNAFIQNAPKYTLNFDTIEETKESKFVSLPLSMLNDKMSLSRTLGEHGMPLQTTDATVKFMVAFTTKLRNSEGSIVRLAPIGWVLNKDGLQGFSFDRVCYTPTGTRAARALDATMVNQFTPCGKPDPVLESLSIIGAQKRPALDVFYLMSFASPLVKLSDIPGCIVVGHSSESGIGKTTSMQTGLAMWAHPTRGMGGLSDTLNFTAKMLTIVNSLTRYWDEVKTVADTKVLAALSHMITRQSEKGRSNRSGDGIQEQGMFETDMVVGSNTTLYDALTRESTTTTASHMRVFEFRVPKETHLEDASRLAHLAEQFKSNYGHVGVMYAKYLGENFEALQIKIAAVMDKLKEMFKFREDERFWVSLIARLLVAASVGNQLGITHVDTTGLIEFLKDEFFRMRAKVLVASNDMSQMDNVQGLLSQFLADKRAVNTLWTDTVPAGRGKPIPNSVKILNEGNSADRLGNIQVQISKSPAVLRIANYAITEYMTLRNIPPSIFTASLVKHYGARLTTAVLGGGSRLKTAPLPCWTIDLKGSGLMSLVE